MAKVVDTREAFEAFVLLLRTHEEGVFFSHQNAAGERQWHCGVGKAERVNFDHPEFPVFCATDFLGEQNIAWKFDYQKSGTQEAPKFPYATRLPKVKKKKFTLKAQTEETEISFMEKIKEISVSSV